MVEHPVILHAFTATGAQASFDIGNTAANVATIYVPFDCVVEKLMFYANAAATANATITADSYDGTTQGAADVGSATIPASGAALTRYWGVAGRGLKLKAGTQVLVQVDDAGDTGELGFVELLVDVQPTADANFGTQGYAASTT